MKYNEFPGEKIPGPFCLNRLHWKKGRKKKKRKRKEERQGKKQKGGGKWGKRRTRCQGGGSGGSSSYPETIINHQERDNRIAQPTGEQLSLRSALKRTRYTVQLCLLKVVSPRACDTLPPPLSLHPSSSPLLPSPSSSRPNISRSRSREDVMNTRIEN